MSNTVTLVSEPDLREDQECGWCSELLANNDFEIAEIEGDENPGEYFCSDSCAETYAENQSIELYGEDD